eukprot:56004-Rhodomonas_salina.1
MVCVCDCVTHCDSSCFATGHIQDHSDCPSAFEQGGRNGWNGAGKLLIISYFATDGPFGNC